MGKKKKGKKKGKTITINVSGNVNIVNIGNIIEEFDKLLTNDYNITNKDHFEFLFEKLKEKYIKDSYKIHSITGRPFINLLLFFFEEGMDLAKMNVQNKKIVNDFGIENQNYFISFMRKLVVLSQYMNNIPYSIQYYRLTLNNGPEYIRDLLKSYDDHFIKKLNINYYYKVVQLFYSNPNTEEEEQIVKEYLQNLKEKLNRKYPKQLVKIGEEKKENIVEEYKKNLKEKLNREIPNQQLKIGEEGNEKDISKEQYIDDLLREYNLASFYE